MNPRIAWITYDLPYPSNSGGKLRAYHLIKRLASKFEIDLYSFCRFTPEPDSLAEMKKFCSAINLYQRDPVWSAKNLTTALTSPLPLLNVSYSSPQLRDDLLSKVRQKFYNLVHFEFFGVANLLPKVKEWGVKTVLGEENIEYQIYKDYSQRHKFSPLYPLFLYDVWKMKRWEERLWQESDLNLAVSANDAEVIEGSAGKAPVLVPNGVEILPRGLGPSTSLGSNPNNTAFFAGDLNYQQNRDALIWFLSEILPQIRQEIPNFKVLVLSRTRSNFVNKYSESVEMVVDNESPFEKFTDRVSIFISPVRLKSGTNIKVLQAAASGLPMVGTSNSFVGYEFRDQVEVSIADTADHFASGVVKLLKDRKLAQNLSAAAFAKVKKYSWDNSAKILRDAYLRLLP